MVAQYRYWEVIDKEGKRSMTIGCAIAGFPGDHLYGTDRLAKDGYRLKYIGRRNLNA